MHDTLTWLCWLIVVTDQIITSSYKWISDSALMIQRFAALLLHRIKKKESLLKATEGIRVWYLSWAVHLFVNSRPHFNWNTFTEYESLKWRRPLVELWVVTAPGPKNSPSHNLRLLFSHSQIKIYKQTRYNIVLFVSCTCELSGCWVQLHVEHAILFISARLLCSLKSLYANTRLYCFIHVLITAYLQLCVGLDVVLKCSVLILRRFFFFFYFDNFCINMFSTKENSFNRIWRV